MLSQDELNKIRENPKLEHIPALLEHVAEVQRLLEKAVDLAVLNDDEMDDDDTKELERIYGIVFPPSQYLARKEGV